MIQLHPHDPAKFLLGNNDLASIASVTSEIMRITTIIATSLLNCSYCDYEGPDINHRLGYLVSPGESTSKLMDLES